MILRAGAGLSVECLVLGDVLTNAYVLVGNEAPAVCWVVDPGLGPRPLVERLAAKGLRCERILLTHGHADHIAGVGAVKAAHPDAVVTVPAGDEPLLSDPAANMSLPFGLHITAPPPDETVRPGKEIHLGRLAWRVLDASGHTPGGAAYYCAAAGVVLTGDALFAGSIGRCDIPGASEARLLRNIHENLLTLPGETRVLSGHGPPSTISRERDGHPFLQSVPPGESTR